jgi:hypothetical protein
LRNALKHEINANRRNVHAPHGMCGTLKDEVNADLLAFLKA